MTRQLASWVLATSLLIALPTPVNGQAGQVTGMVRDEASGEWIGSALVTLELASDTLRSKSAPTNAFGRFLLVAVPPGQYRIRVESLGYGMLTLGNLVVHAGSTHDLGALELAIEAIELDSLAVTADRSAITFEADRTSYNVAAMRGAVASTIAELLRSIPELTVDFDGRVIMRGSRSAVYIDGRPASMNGMGLMAFLEQFPAENLERIEVIDHPSARYAAEGSGGIVNIVLREGVGLGMTGTVFMRGGTRGHVGGGGHGAVQRGPWTLNSGVSIDRSNGENSSLILRHNLLANPMTFLEQETMSNRSGRSANANLDLRYQGTERADFRVTVRGSGRDAGSEGLTTTTHMDADQVPTSVYRRSSSLDAGNLTGRFATGFNYAWERQRHEIGIELGMNQNRDGHETREELDAIDLFEATVPLPPSLSHEDGRHRDGAVTLTLDYMRPWAEDGRVEIGYQLSKSVAETDRLLSEWGGTEESLSEMDAWFEHHQSVSALYITMQRQLGALGVQVGLRGERSDTRFEIPTNEVFENDHYSLFPSANLAAPIGQGGQIRLSYSRRIGRPHASVLNPINRSTDPLNREVGNPDLNPAGTHSLILDANWLSPIGRLRLAPYYRRTQGTWAQITLVDRDGVSTRTWDNVASEEQYGATVSVWLPRTETINGFVSMGANGQIRDASNLSEEYSSSSFRWDMRANVEVLVAGQLSTELRFAYSPPVDLPQGRSDGRASADLGVRYRFFGRKASLDVAVQDPFGLRGSSVATRDHSHVQVRRNSESSRSVQVSMSYFLVPGSR